MEEEKEERVSCSLGDVYEMRAATGAPDDDTGAGIRASAKVKPSTLCLNIQFAAR